MTHPAERSVAYLNGWRFLVAGQGAVGANASSVLSAIGASVTIGTDSDLAAEAARPTYDGVICDRVETGADSEYLAWVANWLASDLTSPRAWVTASAFGLDGPARHYRGSNLVCSAAGGLLAAVSDSSGQLVEIPGQQALQTVGQASALAALHGISLSRDLSEPVHQDLSAQETVTFATVQQDLARFLYRCAFGGSGPAPLYSAPARDFAAADGIVKILVLDSQQFVRLTEVLDRPDWIAKYPTNPARAANADAIDPVVSEWVASRSKVECERILQAHGIPATAVRAMSEVGHAEQFQARGWPDLSDSSDRAKFDILPGLIERHDLAVPVADAPDRRLRDLRVVEVTNVLAGPLAASILGGMGADVVRLEDESRLDIYRVNGPFVDGVQDVERAAYFIGANYSKRSVAKGIGEDKAFSQSALAWADAMIENVGPSRLARLGIESEPVGGGKGGLAISISGFGRSGPGANFRAYAPNVHGYAGLEDEVNRVAGSAATVRTPFADYLVAFWAATLAAAWWLGGMHDEERADLSMAEVVALRLSGLLAHSGPTDRDAGENVIVRAPNDGHLAVTVPAGAKPRVLIALREHGLLSGSVDGAVEPTDSIDIADALSVAARLDVDATVRVLQNAGIAAYVARANAALVADEQLRARQFYFPVEHPVIGPTEIIVLPWKVAGAPRSGYRRAPLFGEDDAWAKEAFSAT